MIRILLLSGIFFCVSSIVTGPIKTDAKLQIRLTYLFANQWNKTRQSTASLVRCENWAGKSRLASPRVRTTGITNIQGIRANTWKYLLERLSYHQFVQLGKRRVEIVRIVCAILNVNTSHHLNQNTLILGANHKTSVPLCLSHKLVLDEINVFPGEKGCVELTRSLVENTQSSSHSGLEIILISKVPRNSVGVGSRK
ncbi:hypothetical protein MT325_m761R [Paramecium bursaria chlorella virus MT325]|uniref:Uncharacterized protein m761R n=1 Tax=Paramecium bursaria Chlorella virus MT325 TaxID=346932 RepID=A7IVE1_PBCVM|nr:hypothetical protein MT325_m761R [Paramecium bursaria chlorella virus MT325]